MKIDKLIQILEDIKESEGNIRVEVRDCTGLWMSLDTVCTAYSYGDEVVVCLED
jgi:hypothetical protein